MKYLLEKYSDEYIILNEDSDYQAGNVRPLKLGLRDPRFSVVNDNGKEIAIVNSIDHAIPALAAYYEENPPQWEGEGDSIAYICNGPRPEQSIVRIVKETQFGTIWVDQIKSGQWVAYRNHHELLIDGKIAGFATCQEAQRAADAHLCDGYPNSKTTHDGYSWLPDQDFKWWMDVYRVAARATRAANAPA